MTASTPDPTDWLPVPQAAERIERSTRRLYEYLQTAGPEQIRRMRIRRTTYVHIPDLLDYERTVPAPGRPRKEAP